MGMAACYGVEAGDGLDLFVGSRLNDHGREEANARRHAGTHQDLLVLPNALLVLEGEAELDGGLEPSGQLVHLGVALHLSLC